MGGGGGVGGGVRGGKEGRYRLALSGLLMKSCSKFQSENSNHSDSVGAWTTFFQFHGTISLELTAGHS